MRTTTILKALLPALVLALAACRSARTAEGGAAKVEADAFDKAATLRKVADAGRRGRRFVTSKIKVNVRVGGEDISLSGSLRMKRDDVIRLQLVAMGFIEAGRIEFTPTYVLLMDRINKQYIKVAYKDVDFLRESGLNFHSLQALFWDELFLPGATGVSDAALASYNAYPSGTDVAVTYERGPLAYRWMADKGSGLIKTANVTYRDTRHGNTTLTWHYGAFAPMGAGRFPMSNDVTVKTGSREVRLSYSMNSIGDDGDWETRTQVSGRYKEVRIDDILSKLSSL